MRQDVYSVRPMPHHAIKYFAAASLFAFVIAPACAAETEEKDAAPVDRARVGHPRNRPKEIRNGLSVPPKMTLRNVFQMCTRPTWSFSQLFAAIPQFATLKPYIPPGLSMKHLGLFMDKTFSGRLTASRIRAIRDQWKGNLVIKGIVNPEDAELALSLGADGIIVSNHGGRQLDQGQSTIKTTAALAKAFKGRTKIMMDGGIRSGSDIAVAMASGAEFTFLGRSPMYGVCAMVSKGKNGVHRP